MVTLEEKPLKFNKKPLSVKPPKSFKDKFKHFKEHITVEPVLATYVIPQMLAKFATQNLYLDKACRVNIGYEEKICNALVAKEGDQYEKEEKIIQQLVTGMEIWKIVLQTLIPSILILFLGAWSDRTGKRKICILLPIIGDFFMCVSNIINVYYFYELPLQVTMFFEAFIPAMTGGWIVHYMGIFSYISDISSEKSRTFRIGIAKFCLTAGTPIGSALSGILLKQIGYYGVFTLSSLLCLFSMFYGFFVIKDPERPDVTKELQEEPTGCFIFFKSFFAPRHVKDTLIVAFKEGPNNRKTKSILLITALVFVSAPTHGEFNLRYLFCRSRFNWDALKYSYYNTFYIVLHSFGALITICLFSRRFGWDDSVLGMISVISKIAGGLATGFSRNALHMYIAVVVETFNGTAFTAMRSISSKLVSSDELGKMFSVFNLTEILTSMVFGPIYSWVYKVTVTVDDGVIYYLSTCISVVPVAIFWWFFKQHRLNTQASIIEKVNEMDVLPKREQISIGVKL